MRKPFYNILTEFNAPMEIIMYIQFQISSVMFQGIHNLSQLTNFSSVSRQQT